jgi:flagella basal body P-ring formation protein FlgA
MMALWFFQVVSLLVSLLVPLPASLACVEVSTDRVFGQDLARREPAFAVLSPELALTYAPLPGTQRVLSHRELLAFLRRNGVEPAQPLREICIERKTEPLREEDLIAALERAVNLPDVHVEIVDYPRQRMPPGILQFQSGAAPAAPARSDLPVLWTGRLLYDGRSASIWVKAVIWVEHTVVVASEDLPAGVAIRPGSLRLEPMREFPLGRRSANGLEQVIGRKPRRPIRKASQVALADLDPLWQVFQGDKVLVRVVAGATHLTLEAVALSSGRLGDEVSLRNPITGRVFRAVVDARGTALMQRRDLL